MFRSRLQFECASPGLQSGEAGFQTRENALSSDDRALQAAEKGRIESEDRTVSG
jgi:hypothetical protein